MKLATIAFVGILTLTPSLAYAACSATYPVGNTADSVVSFLASGTNLPFVGPTTFQAAEAGTLTYDSASNTLQLCNGTAWTAIATSSGAGSSGTAGYVQLSGGSGAFASSSTTAGQQLFWDTTNHRLGIGTTTPAIKLDVSGASRITGTGAPTSGVGVETSYDSGTGTGYIIAYDRTGAVAKPLHLGGNGGTGIRIDAAGNVGINDTNPQAKLSVNGNLESKGNSIAITLNVCGGACASYHALSTLINVGAIGYAWSTQQNTNTSLFSHNGAGTITVARAGVYRIRQRAMMIPTADTPWIALLCPFVNGSANCGSVGSWNYRHGYYPNGWWANYVSETTVEVPVNGTIQYGYNIYLAMSYWAYDGYTMMEVTRVN